MAGSIQSLPERIELIRNISGVDYYNDTAATRPTDTAQALLPFPDRSVILIAGGEFQNRKSLKNLSPFLTQKACVLILFGKNRDEFYKIWKDVTETYLVVTLKDAVQLAAKKAKAGNAVLFSPAAPPDPRDPVDVKGRGEKFKKFVNEISF